MADVDKVIKCRDCGEEFVFTAGEQAFYRERGFQHEPTRCRRCRDNKKMSGGGGGGGMGGGERSGMGGGPREFHDALDSHAQSPRV